MAEYREDLSKGGVNPYHFVQMGAGVIRDKVKYGSLTGVIRCRLKNTTPLCIPDMQEAKPDHSKQEHRAVPFFSVDGKPIIPGSELRGVIRSAFETLSNSCFSVNNNNHLTARSSVVRKPGILRYETADRQWHLYEAKAYKMGYDGKETFSETADSFQREWLNRDRKNREHSVLYRFITDFVPVEADNLEKAVDDYGRVCDIYAKNNPELKQKHIIHKPKKDNKCYPVYYLLNENDGVKTVYLSPAQISRSVFHNRLKDLLGSYSKCTCTDSLCEACRLFGMIGEGRQKPSAVASRVRFTDAQCISTPRFRKQILQELSSPKLSAVEFYTTAPQMRTLWNYDTPGVRINGRKFYFHHTTPISPCEKTKRNITAKLIEPGAGFAFDVFFEHLTEDELKKLVWTLALGENDPNGKQQHKIGHGKPLGLGSTKITVDSVTLRSFDPQTLQYSEVADQTDFFTDVPFDAAAGYFIDYMHITDFTFLNGQCVKYPYGDDGHGNPTSCGTLSWFKYNHNSGKTVKAGEQCPIGYSLPRLTDDSLVIPALIADSGGKDGYSGGERRQEGRRRENPAPMHYETKPTKLIAQYEEFRCKATKKCKGIVRVQKSGSFAKKQTVECPVCKKPFEVKV